MQVRTIADVEQAMAQTYAGMPGADYKAELQPGDYNPTSEEVAWRKEAVFLNLCDYVIQQGLDNFEEVTDPGWSGRQRSVSLGQVPLGNPITVHNTAEVHTPRGVLQGGNGGTRQLLGSLSVYTLDFNSDERIPILHKLGAKDSRSLTILSRFSAAGFDPNPSMPRLIPEKIDVARGMASNHILGVSFKGRPMDETEGGPLLVRRARIAETPNSPEKLVPQAGEDGFNDFVSATLTMELLDQIKL